MFFRQLTAADYQIDYQKKLGQGAYAKVYAGTCQEKPAAIKVSRPSEGQELKDEIEIITLIEKSREAQTDDARSKYILSYYGFSQIEILGVGYHHLAMEFMNQGTLEDWVFSSLLFNWHDGYNFVIDVINGLSYLHEVVRIAHCDIKTGNILLNQDTNGYRYAKICDFNLALTIDDHRKSDGRGSPLFSAPEIFDESKPHSNKSDIFSLAIVLWEMSSRSNIEDHYNSRLNIYTIFELQDFICGGKRAAIPKDCPGKIAGLIKFFWQPNPDHRPTASEALLETKTDLDTISHKLAKYC